MNIAHNALEHIVEIVSNASSKLSHGLHFLPLAQLLFEHVSFLFRPLALGYVLNNNLHRLHLSVFAYNGAYSLRGPAFLPLLFKPTELHLLTRDTFNRPHKTALYSAHIVRMDNEQFDARIGVGLFRRVHAPIFYLRTDVEQYCGHFL